MPPGSDDAALAANWKVILLVDAALGVAVLAVGIVLVVVGNAMVGALLGAAGAAYVVAGLRRRRRWRRARLDAGLDA